MQTRRLNVLAVSLLFLAVTFSTVTAAELTLKKGDHICLVGNALGERMQHQNWWETLLHQRFAQHELVVRNLCFPGDEPHERIRSQNFGTPTAHLTHSKATVLLFFFGFNEAFSGSDGLDDFKAQIARLIAETRQQDYSGKGPPRMVFISPIAFEKTGNPNLPDGQAHNRRLELYTKALREVTGKAKVGLTAMGVKDRINNRLQVNASHNVHLWSHKH